MKERVQVPLAMKPLLLRHSIDDDSGRLGHQEGKPVSVTQILQKAEEEAARPTEPAK
jgi:hypothetical protein